MLLLQIILSIQTALNKAVMNDMRGNKDNIQEAVLVVELVRKINVFGYQGDQPSPFLKITVALPRLIAACKRLLDKENVYPTFQNHRYQAFESNIDFDIRLVKLCRTAVG